MFVFDSRISVLVEKIKKEEQVEKMVKPMGAYIQKYYYARPMPEEEFLEYLQHWQKKWQKP